MRFMLDTNLCIALMRGKADAAFHRLRALAVDEAGVSTITLAELRFGASKSARTARHELLIVAFCAPLAITDFDARAAEAYGAIRATLEAAGTPIGPLDTLIAAHALSLGATLVTANVREFERVPGLVVENWLVQEQ
jgi:tRNA(fMet)-specific endonuclease VapC